MPEDETPPRISRARADGARTDGYNPQALTAGMAVVLEILVGLPERADLTPATLAFSTDGGSIPVFEVVTVLAWISALAVIRRLTSPSEITR